MMDVPAAELPGNSHFQHQLDLSMDVIYEAATDDLRERVKSRHSSAQREFEHWRCEGILDRPWRGATDSDVARWLTHSREHQADVWLDAVERATASVTEGWL